MKPTNWRRREEQRKEAEAEFEFQRALGPLLGFVPEDPFKTTPKPKLPCARPQCADPLCDRDHESQEVDDAEVGRCACGAVFYSTDAAHDHECPLESEESEEVRNGNE